MHGTDFSTLFELLPIGAYRSSLNGVLLRANAALVRLNGYASEAELLAMVNERGSDWYVDGQTRTSEHLTLPHPRAAERDFVLRPWLSIEPDAVLGGVPVADLLSRLDAP